MPNDPFNQVYRDRSRGNHNDLTDDAIGTIETSDECSEWRNNLAEQICNKYRQRRP